MLERLSRFSRRRRRLVIVFWLLLPLAGGWAASSISGALSQSFEAPGRPAFEVNEEIAQRFGTGGAVAPIVAVASLPEGGPRVTDPAARDELGRAVTALRRAVPGSRTVSFASTGERAFVSGDGRVTFALLFPPLGRPAPDENPQALAAAPRSGRNSRSPARPCASPASRP